MTEFLDRDELPVSREECPCHKWSETEYTESGSVANNMEYHTYEEPCEECGTPRTKYRDLGTKGRYVCPECR